MMEQLMQPPVIYRFLLEQLEVQTLNISGTGTLLAGGAGSRTII